jgi:two-component system response regulator FlrC
VRELDNVIQRALILQQGQEVVEQDIVFESLTGSADMAVAVTNPIETVPPSVAVESTSDLRSQEQRHILDMLEKNQGSRRITAKELGISERTLRYKIARFREQGIQIPEKFGKNSAY